MNTKKFANRTNSDNDNLFAMTYCLFNDWVSDLNDESEEDSAIWHDLLERFAKAEGVDTQAPYCMLYMGFVAGVSKGFTAADSMKSNT